MVQSVLCIASHPVMFKFVNKIGVVVSVLIVGVSMGQPVITNESLDAVEVIQSEPGLAPVISANQWAEASQAASIELLHAYLNLQVVFDDNKYIETASKWWLQLLDQNPRAAAAAVARLDTKYIVWDISQWPTDRSAFLSEYRVALMVVLFESYQALSIEIDQLKAEIDAFVPPDITPPEGLPFRTDPSVVSDPVLRAEYQTRLNDRVKQRNAKVLLGELQNIEGELLYSTSNNVAILYKEAGDKEVQAFVDLLVGQGWAGSELAISVGDSWPIFQQKLQDARDLLP